MKNVIMTIVWITVGLFFGSWLKLSDYLPAETTDTSKNAQLIEKNTSVVEPKEETVTKSCQTLSTEVNTSSSKYFVNENTLLTEKTFTLSMSKLDRNDAELFESLNHSFYGLFEFESEDEYKRLLHLGMPSIEELRHVYNTPLNLLLKESAKITQTANWPKYDGIPEHMSRMNALILNRAIDEFLAEYQLFQPDYQQQKSIDNRQLPAGLNEKYLQMLSASGLSMNTMQMSSARLAKLKFSQLNGSIFPNYEILSLALLKNQLPDTKVVDNYFANNPPTKADKLLFNSTLSTLSY